jgi:hypothetical protein
MALNRFGIALRGSALILLLLHPWFRMMLVLRRRQRLLRPWHRTLRSWQRMLHPWKRMLLVLGRQQRVPQQMEAKWQKWQQSLRQRCKTGTESARAEQGPSVLRAPRKASCHSPKPSTLNPKP